MADRLSLTSAKSIVKHFNTYNTNTETINTFLGPEWYVINPTSHGDWFDELQPFTEHIGTHSYEQAIHLVTKKLWKEAKKVNKTKFVFGMPSEGFTYPELKFYSDCFEHMSYSEVLAGKWKHHHFAHLYSAHPHPINQKYLSSHYKNFKLCQGMTIICTGNLEQMMQAYLCGWLSDEEKKEFDQLNSVPTVKPYKFLFYNNHPKLNRTYLVGQIMHRNLESQGLMSLNLGHDKDEQGREDVWDRAVTNKNVDYILNEYFPRTGREIFNYITENKEKMMALKPLGTPRWEVANDTYDSYMGLDADGRNNFRSAYFGIITETKYFQDRNITCEIRGTIGPNTVDSNFIDCITFTEKTYKFISGKIPFILLGMPKSLRVLKDSGYKTFHPYINETYDSIEDDELRLVAIADEIERLCGLSDDEWLEIQRDLLPRLEYNYQLLLKQQKTLLHIIIND